MKKVFKSGKGKVAATVVGQVPYVGTNDVDEAVRLIARYLRLEYLHWDRRDNVWKAFLPSGQKVQVTPVVSATGWFMLEGQYRLTPCR